MKKILRIGLSAAALFVCGVAAAQPPVLIHSHNDYCRRAPFWQAYAQQQYDKLAATLRKYLDLDAIYKMMREYE